MQDLGSTLDAATVLCFCYSHKWNNMGMDADSMLCINRRFLIICYFYHLALFCSFMAPLLLFVFIVVQCFIPAYTHIDIYPGTNLPHGAVLISARHKVDRKSFLCITGPLHSAVLQHHVIFSFPRRETALSQRKLDILGNWGHLNW